ncbi:hypothetical protein ACI7YQ_12260 [Alteromonas marina]|uniref:hypothetical protein n=1 Tax=unclassified Alteromonas TaxID=2614992 RepID=UPI0012E433CD|nr:hypothetical protein [Alteromonas sp. KUL150]GFD74990.1 hypothetical protein KUL113_44100 [Tenacibaculum sp. KUL113]GFD84335.1 hypothetical protein KUL150_03940 [Alteromonas sp. KUL150]|tara:strand:- start:366 stop:590 length:225 start_codon:yes stop_codon:yes gene_type:complete
MKGLVLIGLTAMAFSLTAMASETAPAELVEELTQFCQEVAEEEGTKGKPENEFVLECVNDELEAEGYAKVSSLD